jgi:hypothetical protein
MGFTRSFAIEGFRPQVRIGKMQIEKVFKPLLLMYALVQFGCRREFNVAT